MKKLVIVIVVLALVAVSAAGQQLYGEFWDLLDHDQKKMFIVGANQGAQGLLTYLQYLESEGYDVSFVFEKLFALYENAFLKNREVDRTIELLDEFYRRPKNRGVSLRQALYVMDKP